jgi:ketosteroid isomerase-like protein
MSQLQPADLASMQEIRDVLSMYCERLDAFDVDGLVDLFTDDCIVSGRIEPGGAECRGRDMFRNMLVSDPKGSRGSRYTHHELGQVRIEIAGDHATSLGYATADHERMDGTRTTIRFQYRDKLVFRGGRWLIAERRLLTTVNDEASGISRARIPRQTPG